MNLKTKVRLAISTGVSAKDTTLKPWTPTVSKLIETFRDYHLVVSEEIYKQKTEYRASAEKRNADVKIINARLKVEAKAKNQPHHVYIKNMQETVRLPMKWKDYKFFCAGGLVQGHTGRNAEAIPLMSVIIIDADESLNQEAIANEDKFAPPMDQVLVVLNTLNIPYIAHTSASHKGEEKPRYRIMIFIDREITVIEARLIYTDIVERIQDEGVPLAIARESYATSQSWYMPVVRQKYEHEYKFSKNLEPKLLNVDETLKEIKQRGSRDPLNKKPPVKLKKPITLPSRQSTSKSKFSVDPNDDLQSFPEIFLHFYNTIEYAKELLEEYGYTPHGTKPHPKYSEITEYYYLSPDSSSGNPGGRLFLGSDGRVKYYTYHGNDSLKGIKCETEEELKDAPSGYRTIDNYEMYKRLELGDGGQEPSGRIPNDESEKERVDREAGEKEANKKLLISVRNRLNINNERLFMRYLSWRYIYITGENMDDIFDRVKPSRHLNAAKLSKIYGWAMIPRINPSSGEVKGNSLSLYNKWINGMTTKEGKRKIADARGFNPTKEALYVDIYDNLKKVNTFQYPIFKNLGKPDFPEYKKVLDDHIMYLCNGNKEHFYVLKSWIAGLVQRPGQRPKFAILLISTMQRIGKTLLFNLIKPIVGKEYYSPIKSTKILNGERGTGSNFDDEFYNKRLVVFNEIDMKRKDGFDFYDFLKTVITDDDMFYQLKYARNAFAPMFFGVAFCSNNKVPIPLPVNDGRFWVVEFETLPDMYVSKEEKGKCVMSHVGESIRVCSAPLSKNPKEQEYANQVLHSIYYDLDNWDLTNYDKYLEAPMSDAKKFIINTSLDPIDVHAKNITKFVPYAIAKGQLDNYLNSVIIGTSTAENVKEVVFSRILPFRNKHSVYLNKTTFRNEGKPYEKDKISLYLTERGGTLYEGWGGKQTTESKKFGNTPEGRKLWLKSVIIEVQDHLDKIIIPFSSVNLDN